MAVVQLTDDQYAVDTALSFSDKPSARVYSGVQNTGMDIICYVSIGPLTAWVDDHFFMQILKVHLDEYNELCHQWYVHILKRGEHQMEGHIWYGGQVFEGGTLEEFDEDCRFPLQDLSQSSSQSEHDSRFTYNFDNINFIFGYPLGTGKRSPFCDIISLLWLCLGCTIETSLSGTGKEEEIY